MISSSRFRHKGITLRAGPSRAKGSFSGGSGLFDVACLELILDASLVLSDAPLETILAATLHKCLQT
jgi:hypothetical protein